MGIKEDILKAKAQLNAAIDETMQGDVADMAKSHIAQAVATEVYAKYISGAKEPYQSRGATGGGLQDVSTMQANYDPALKELQVWSDNRDGGRNVTEIVKSGRGYTWEHSRMYQNPFPRPFIAKAEQTINDTSALELALLTGLKKSGIEVTSIF